MFSVSGIAKGALHQAPSFLLGRIPGIADGVIAAYVFLLFFWGGLGILSTCSALAVLAVVAFAVGKTVDVVAPQVVSRLSDVLILGSVSSTQHNMVSSSHGSANEGEKLD